MSSASRGVICSSAGNHAQGVALAARIHGMKAVVVMAKNATPSKIEATKRVRRRGRAARNRSGTRRTRKPSSWWRSRGLTYIHPFDDLQLIAGQGTVGLEIIEDWPEVDVVVVPIGGGGLISGVSLALKSVNPKVRIIGVESSGAPGMQRSVAAGAPGDAGPRRLHHRRASGQAGGKSHNLDIVREAVDEIVTLPDSEIFDAMLWLMHHSKLVVEGAAAAPVGALLKGLIKAPAGSKVVSIISGGNVNLEQLRGLKWN